MAVAVPPALRGRLLYNELLARHTSLRVGGPARVFYEPADVEDLAVFLAQIPQKEFVIFLGLGSNVLIRDGGIRGTVIALAGVVTEMSRIAAGTVHVGAGVTCNKVARFCARLDLVGTEFLAGIPGTMGGALAMNAGAFGGETWALVQRLETIDRRGQRRWRSRQDYQIGYREVRGPDDEWFVTAELHLQAGDGDAGLARVRELLQRRNRTQPTNQPSCGSVFRNPPGDYAARLIETAGLKGHCVGGACISARHANFIVNVGTATAQDIETLMAEIMTRVEKVHGVHLIPEVHVVGNA